MTIKSVIGPIKYHRPGLEEIFLHHEELADVALLTSEVFEAKSVIPVVMSRNRVYGFSIDGKMVKACLRFNHQVELFERAQTVENVARIIAKAPFGKNITVIYTEWIDGTCRMEQLQKSAIYEIVPPQRFYEIGRILGRLANIEKDSRVMAMSDIYLSNFVEDSRGSMWLIDLTKLHWTLFPEKFIYHHVLMDLHIPAEHKQALSAGYLEHVKTPVSRVMRDICEFTGKRMRQC